MQKKWSVAPEAMITEVTEVVLGRGVTEHDAIIRPIVVFNSGWRGIFVVTQDMFFDYDIGGCDKEEADVLVDFSGHLDAIWPTL